MAKGKVSSKIAKGAKGRKNHGPKRHLNHDVAPKALRMSLERRGAMTKYYSFDSFCVALNERKFRADFKLLWQDFSTVRPQGQETYRDAQNRWFKEVQERATILMKQEKGNKRA